MLKNKKVFVTGGAGVIGLQLVNELYKMGAIILVGDLKPRPKSFYYDIKYLEGDLNDLNLEDLNKFSPEYVFHLAASFERLDETPQHYNENWNNNIKLSHHIISICMNTKSIKKLVFASSYLVYDERKYLGKSPLSSYKISEKDDINPRNLTGLSKLYTEREIEFVVDRDFNTLFDFIHARIFRVYGQGSGDVISRWINHILMSETILTYNINNSYDFIRAEDVAKILIELSYKTSGVFNVGTGESTSIHKVLEILKRIHDAPIHTMVGVDSDQSENSSCDTTKIQSALNYNFDLKIEDGIKKLYDFYKFNANGKN
jgi:carbamoyl-phosphate synthase large subunit